MSIAVRTLFFAAYRDLVGCSSLDVELPEGSSVGDLVAVLRGRGHPFSVLPDQPAVALNRVYASHDEALSEGDEVAFIPPVAGG
jgi:molybdopterin converting factor subunit 1